MKRSNFSVWPLVVLMSVLLKNGDAFNGVQHKYNFTKMDVRLDCPFLEGPRIVWKETDVGEIIAINGTIFSTNAKYNNFDVSSERNISTLTINRAEMEDEGIYSCHSLTGSSTSFWLHLQNPPTLSISVNGKVVNTSIDLDENTEVTVECNATGADPPVYVSLVVDDELLTLDEQIMNNYTQTAYASSRLTVTRSHREIECIDSEQKMAMYKKTIYLNVNYEEFSVDSIFEIAVTVVVGLLIGSITLIIFKSKELSVYKRAELAIFAGLLAVPVTLIIFKHEEFSVYEIAGRAINYGIAVGFLGIIISYEELLVHAIVVNAIGVVVVLAGVIGLIFFKDKEFSAHEIAGIATNAGLAVGFLGIIISNKKFLVYAIVVNAIGVVVFLAGVIGLIFFKDKEVSVFAIIAIFYVIFLLAAFMRLINFRHKELLYIIAGIVIGVVLILAGLIGLIFFKDTGLLVYAIVVIGYVVLLLVGFIGMVIIKRIRRANRDDNEPVELQPL